MSPLEIVGVFSAVLNFVILLVTAWIKVDFSNLKVYMHEHFVTRAEFDGRGSRYVPPMRNANR